MCWFNCFLLYFFLHKRGHFHVPLSVAKRIGAQLIAAALMGALLWTLRSHTDGLFAAAAHARILGLALLVGSGVPVYFGAAWLMGGFDRELLGRLSRKRRTVAAREGE